MRSRIIAGAITLAILAIAACATVPQDNYVICNDMAPNVTCPDNTANIVVSM
jgi:hypothetical protein